MDLPPLVARLGKQTQHHSHLELDKWLCTLPVKAQIDLHVPRIWLETQHATAASRLLWSIRALLCV